MENCKTFVELGLNAGLIGDGRFSGVKQRIDGDVVMTTEKTDYALRNNYVGVWGGAGVSIKRFAIEAVYILPNGVVRPADISDRIRIASFQASYNFGKR